MYSSLFVRLQFSEYAVTKIPNLYKINISVPTLGEQAD